MKTTIPATTTTKNRTETKFKAALGIAGQLFSWESAGKEKGRTMNQLTQSKKHRQL
jgi:hypothetical protein